MSLPYYGNILNIPIEGDESFSQIHRSSILHSRVGGSRQRVELLRQETLTGAQKSELFSKFSPHLSRKGSRGVLKKILGLPIRSMRVLENILVPIDNQTIYLFEGNIQKSQDFRERIWSCLCKIFLKKGRMATIKFWKNYCLRQRRYYFGYEGPLLKHDIFRYPADCLLAKRPEELTKFEKSRICSWICSRSLPCGDETQERISLEKHKSVLTSPPRPLERVEIQLIQEGVRMAAREIRGCMREEHFHNRTAHVSLSNSASIEAPRSAGGRRAAFTKEFKEFMEGEWSEDNTRRLPFNIIVNEEAGIQRWRTLHQCYDMSKTFGEIIEGQELYIHPDRYGMEESQLGRSAFICAFYGLVRDGYLTWGGEPTGLPLEVKRATIAEPGGKMRIVTAGQSNFITYGQPIAHYMREMLSCDPTLKTGLGAAAQSYELFMRLNKYRIHYPGQMLFADFEEATDFIQFDVARLIMDTFCEELDMSPFVKGFFHLLAQEVYVQDGDFFSRRGLLMGFPGTKIVLHLISKSINCIMHGTIRNPAMLDLTPFGCAGDDVFDIIPVGTFWVYRHLTEVFRMKISADKTGVYKYGSPYCEVLLVGTDFSKSLEDPDCPFVDGIRFRLCSPCTKQEHGDEEKNPVFGKSFKFSRELNWNSRIYGEDLINVCYRLFIRAFRRFIKPDFHIQVPSNLGGLGLITEDQFVSKDYPEWWESALSYAYRNPDEQRWITTWSEKYLLSRGREAELSEVETFQTALGMCLDLAGTEEIINGLQAHAGTPAYNRLAVLLNREVPVVEVPRRFKDKIELIRRLGFVDLKEVAVRACFHSLWEEQTKVTRGWSTAPFAERTRAQQAHFSSIGREARLTADVRRQLFKWGFPSSYQWFIPPEPEVFNFYIEEAIACGFDLPILEIGDGPYNPFRGKAVGDQLFLEVPNTAFFNQH